MSQYTMHVDKEMLGSMRRISDKYKLPISSLLRAVIRKLDRDPFERQLHTDASQDFVAQGQKKYATRRKRG